MVAKSRGERVADCCSLKLSVAGAAVQQLEGNGQPRPAAT